MERREYPGTVVVASGRVYGTLSADTLAYVSLVPEHGVPSSHGIFPGAASQTTVPYGDDVGDAVDDACPVKSHDALTSVEVFIASSDVTVIVPPLTAWLTSTSASSAEFEPDSDADIV